MEPSKSICLYYYDQNHYIEKSRFFNIFENQLTKLKKTVTFLVLLLSASLLYAQPYYFKHYQVENGLSNNTVFCSVQDGKGFMWFGTKDGLNRFDGYSFKTYRNDPSNPKSIGNGLIYSLHCDKEAILWVGTNKGLYIYDPVNDSFSPVKHTEQMNIHHMESDDEGNLWITVVGKLHKYNKQKKTLYAFKDKAPFDVSSVYQASDHTMWISTTRGTIEKYNRKNNTFRSYNVLDKNDEGKYNMIAAVRETGDGKLVIGTTTQGLKLFDIKTGQVKNLITLNDDKTHIFVRDVAKLSDHEFWAGTESGVYIYNHQNGKITHLQKQYNNNYTLSDNAVYTVARDREGGIWSGTYFGGINYYSPQYSIFTKYFPMQQANSINGSDVREIQKDKNGNFWIGTEDAGLNKLDAKTGLFTNFLPNGTKNSIAYYNIHGLQVDGDKLWIGSFEHGIDLMDIHTNKIIKHYSTLNRPSLRSNFMIAFYKTRANHMMLASTNGLYTYDQKKDDFVRAGPVPYTFYNSICEDHEGYIWAGTFNEGVFRYKPGESTFRNFRSADGDLTSLGNNTINNIFEDSKQRIWVSTDGGGLCLYDRKKETFKRYTTKQGLPSNFLFRIEEDADHKLWISSTRGLVHFDPESGSMKIYSKSDGLLTDQFNYNSSFKDADGRLYFGSVKGLISFQPGQLHNKSYAVPVFLTDFQIENEENADDKNRSPLKKSILYTDTIVLNSSQSSFSINFAALSYFSPEMTQYAYKMSGLYKEWVYLKTNRKVYFTKLAPGDYTFEAKGLINGSNEWSNRNVKIFIKVLPPFWKSPAAYILYFLFLVATGYYLVMRYHRRTARKNKRRMEVFEHEKEKEIYQAKIEFFTMVSHEIRTPLTLIKGPMEKIIKLAHQVPSIEKNLRIMDRNTNRLLNLTNQLLDFRKTEINGFSLNFVKANISEILQDITLNFQPLAEHKNISLQTDLLEDAFYAYVDTEALHKILSSLIDNAIKYGKSRVIVSLLIDPKDENYFQVKVMSDGAIIPAYLHQKVFEPFYRIKETEISPGTGIGLSISRSLAELHQGTLVIKNTIPDFNIFVIRLPIHQLIEFNLNGKWKKH